MYAPVVEVHWVTVKQLAVLEPTLVESTRVGARPVD
ncbi:phosphogluconate dehydrogenase C-terminal domain-containing protein [Streptomyces sp. NPDC058316]